MSIDALRELRHIVERESGIQIGEQKLELLKNRIRKRLRVLQVSNEAQYLEVIQSDVEGSELVHLLDVISTNHTFFWREHEHFPIYERILERLKTSGVQEVKTWCAASSSGEEPYTLSIINEEIFGKGHIQAKILATDISTRILHKANGGSYSLQSIEKLPANYQKYFHQSDEPEWMVADDLIKRRLTFKKLNLAKFPYPLKGKIDIIFCRNVMIYFDSNLKQKIIDQMYNLLSPGGYLFISHSENLLGITHDLITENIGVFRKRGGTW